MWIEETKDEVLRTWIKNCPAMKLVSRPSGEILWANAAFLEWSQYTLNELKKLTWMQISVPDKNLEADTEELKSLDAYRPAYTVKKQYVPKGSKPEWGTLNVMRYPVEGEIEICLCTWEPLKNGTATAFALAMDQSKLLEAALAEIRNEMKVMNSLSDAETAMVRGSRAASQNPKLVVAVIVILATLMGGEATLAIMQRLGLMPLPPQQQQLKQVNANTIDFPPVRVVQVQTKSGRVYSWEKIYDWSANRTLRSVPPLAGRSGSWANLAGSGRGPDGAGDRFDQWQSGSVESMPAGQSWQWSAGATASTCAATAERVQADF